MMKKLEKGFTLIELMIVVAIIGILAAVAIPKFADLIDRSKEAKTKGNLSAIRSAVSIYYGSQEGEAPAAGTGLNLANALVTQGGNMTKIPGGEVPVITIGAAETSAEWAVDAASLSIAYDDKGTDEQLTGWAYDPREPEVWVQTVGLDTKSSGIHDW